MTSPTLTANEISLKVTGCTSFRDCSWDIFCQGIEEAQKAEREKINQLIDLANIEVSNEFDDEICENCNHIIIASIHHYIDSFYKNIKSKIAKADDEVKP